MDLPICRPVPSLKRHANEKTLQRLISRFNGLLVMGGAFERKLVALAEAAGLQGVICGHSYKLGLHRVGETAFAICRD